VSACPQLGGNAALKNVSNNAKVETPIRAILDLVFLALASYKLYLNSIGFHVSFRLFQVLLFFFLL
jgi:hypothetical protein